VKIYITGIIIVLTAGSAFISAQSLPLPNHIVIVMEENYAYSDIIGSSLAPEINALISDTSTAIFTQSFALTHPSQPNYLMLYSGSNQAVTDDNLSPNTPFSTCNLGASLLANGYSFIGYSESMPSMGYLGVVSGNYARKHNPWSNWQGASVFSVPQASNQPYTSFPSNYDSLPTVSFVIPNLADDIHNPSDSSVAIPNGDTWFHTNLNNYIRWAKNNNSLLILTFDEDDLVHQNHITTIFAGEMVKGGAYSDTITHYTILRTMEEMYHLPYCGNSATSKAINYCWKTVTQGSATGIKEDSLTDNFIIYPNPTNTGKFTIQMVNHQQIRNMELRLYDLLGNSIYSTNLIASKTDIDLSNQAKGANLVKFYDQNYQVAVKRIIIQ